jgi:predicted aldo/keto reductase-like oxidoreductase
MDKRDSRKKVSSPAARLVASKKILKPLAKPDGIGRGQNPIPRRKLGKTSEELSIVGFAGLTLMQNSQSFANGTVAEAVERGINYFDVAPTYGDAEARLGPALEPYRKNVFLACKTLDRSKDGSAKMLDESLRLLRTDHLDLYQFHALTKISELEQIFGPNGAMETFQAARKAGKIRLIGFSAHSVEVAIAAMDRYKFDTILFPINFVLFSQANFGPQVIKHALKKGVGILALKGMGKAAWPVSMETNHPHEKCFYEPADFPRQAALGYRWTLSQPITSAIPSSDERYFQLGMDIGQHFEPITEDEQEELMASAAGVSPIFHLGSV